MPAPWRAAAAARTAPRHPPSSAAHTGPVAAHTAPAAAHTPRTAAAHTPPHTRHSGYVPEQSNSKFENSKIMLKIELTRGVFVWNWKSQKVSFIIGKLCDTVPLKCAKVK